MEFLLGFNFEEIKIIIQRGWQDLANTDFSQMKFSETELAFKVGAVLAFLILLKIVWFLIGRWLGWEKYSRKDSGHLISGRNGRHLLARFILAVPTIVLLIPISAILFAIADPYFAIIKEEKKYIETRIRIDLKDVSGSMEGVFKETKKTKAEIAANAHLKFLEMRRGKNDRTAFWLFSDDPYPVQEDFVVDDELYYLKVYDAPWELGDGSPENWSEEEWKKFLIPKFRYLQIYGQGGTMLSKTLKAAIGLFDADAKKQKLPPYKPNGRSILIITDVAISDLKETQTDFAELSKRGIRPYIIFIDDSSGEHHEDQLSNISALLKKLWIGAASFSRFRTRVPWTRPIGRKVPRASKCA